ncbi:cold shock domain-containing protein [Kistimonas scapharcae]|uniref:cold shock domain-containing protein n=1 Tax=Kistimonas scapharcae TaxID=1036133 RepID=UPI0031EAF309
MKSWNDDRGFGFIQSDELSNDVFIHISALKGLARKPRVGDTINFDVEQQSNGKQRATNCSIDGVQKVAPRSRQNHYQKRTVNRFIGRLVLIGVVAGAVYGYQELSERDVVPQPQNIMSVFETRESSRTPAFSCNGKTHCSQMTSCAEARFYLDNCPGTQIDGDHDGEPCERQLCKGW